MRLRSYLTLLVVVSLAPLAFFAGFLVWQDLSIEEEVRRTGARDITRALSLAVDRELRTTFSVLETLAASPSLAEGNLKRFRELCAGAVLGRRGVWVILFDPSGQQVLNSSKPFGSPLPNPIRQTKPPGTDPRYPLLHVGGAHLIRKVLSTGKPVVSDLFVALDSGEPKIGVALPILRDGAVAYVLEMSVKPDALLQIFRDQEVPSTSTATIVDEQGHIIARTVNSGAMLGRAIPADLAAMIVRAPEGEGAGRTLEGVEVYHTFARCRTAPWTVSLSVSTETSNARQLRTLLLLGGGAASTLMLGLVVAWLMGRRISGEISSLAGSADAMATGKGGPPEIPAVREVRELRAALIAAGERNRAHERLEFLAEAGVALSSSLDYLETLSKVAELTTRRLSDGCSIHVREESGQIRHVTVLHRDPEKTRMGREIIRRYPFDPKHQPDILRVLATGRPELYPMIRDEALRAAAHDEEHYRLLKDVAMGCGFSLPLRAGERTLGVLTLVWDAGRAYTEEDLALARAIADRAALALENSRLYHQAKTAEEEVRKLNGALEGRVRERTAELEAFTYTVAHDLRAPLRAMQGFADLVLDDAASRLEPSEKDFLKRITQAAERMDALVRDLLAYSRLGSAEVKAESVDLDALVRDVLRGMEAELKARKAKVQVEDPIPKVLAQRPILFQVVANLVSNAAKFVPPGVAPQVRISAHQRPGWIRLVVEDNGIGVDPQYREKLFGVFERLHAGDAYPGTGIGLAIVKRAVERMGGQVGVESREPRGSAFWFELPPAPEPPDLREASGAGRPSGASSRG